MQLVESAPSCLLGKINTESPEIIEKIAIVLWSIWFARNQKIWENKSITPAVTVDISVIQVKEWQQAMKWKSTLNVLKLDQ